MTTVPYIPGSVLGLLNRYNVNYQTIPHRRDFTALETATHTHTPKETFAKVVVLKVDDRYVMAVLPATHRVNLERMRMNLEAATVQLVSEPVMAEIFPDCEPGAEPPFGNLYGLPVYIARPLTEDPTITFNAGTHEYAIEMLYSDFEAIAHPTVMDLSDPK